MDRDISVKFDTNDSIFMGPELVGGSKKTGGQKNELLLLPMSFL
jgi:hypothetical protein